jgi:hypothetical protein
MVALKKPEVPEEPETVKFRRPRVEFQALPE